MQIIKYLKYLFVVSLIVLVSNCAKKESTHEKVFPVNILTIKPKTINSTISIAGTVDSKVHAVVSSPIEGTVESLKVVEGQAVSAGEILCYIMPSDYYNMLGQASAEYERAKLQFNSAIETEKNEYEKKLKEAEEQLVLAKKLYKSMPIVSPVNGIVLSKNIEIGSIVSIKQPLIEIADLKKLIIKSAVSEEYVSKIRLGQEVSVHIHSLDKIMKGKISVITPGIRLESRTADIEISIPFDQSIKPGMSTSLDIIIASKNNVPVIPQDAIIVKPNGEKFIFTVENSIAKLKKITTGIESNTEIEVTSGLKAGDMVVVLGQDNLKDGVKVKLPETGKSDKQKRGSVK